MKNERLLELKREVLKCTKCDLAKTRTNVVFGEGNPDAKILFIGEAPGQDEDKQGRPFVGRAGQLLTSFLRDIGYSRDDVFIANTIKCRPPSNRDPLPQEIEQCKPYFIAQIAIIKPQVICTLGRIPLHNLANPDLKIGEVHGKPFQWHGMVLFPFYHPAAALHNGNLISALTEDFRKMKEMVDKK